MNAMNRESRSPGAYEPIEYWLRGNLEQNFGDFLTPLFVERLFQPIAISDRSYRLIGSVVADFIIRDTPGATPVHPLVFWGCGLRDEASLTPAWRASAEILAVRGPLSQAALGLDAHFPMGDPALLLPFLYHPAPATAFRGCTICIPHFHDRRPDHELRERAGADLLLRPNLPNTRAALLAMIDAIASADFVLSASLHGAIVAAAYGVKFAYWDNDHLDLPFKWADFAASVQMPCCFATNIADGRMLYADVIAPRLRLPSLRPLLAAAPFPVRPEVWAKLEPSLNRTAPPHAARRLPWWRRLFRWR